MKRAQTISLNKHFPKMRVTFAALALGVSAFNSAYVPARDQDYLNTINAEAQNMEEVGNTDTEASTVESKPNNTSAERSSKEQSTFIERINSKLYSNGDNEAAYLKQLEKEVNNLSTPAAAATYANPANKPKQKKEIDLSEQRNIVTQITAAQRKEMEITLETKIPGIYRLYKKLGLTQKRMVVKEYLTNEKISTASKTILKLYGGK